MATKKILGLVGYTDKGDWVDGYTFEDSGETITGYDANDIVHTDKGIFVSKVDGNTSDPDTDSTNWQMWVDASGLAGAENVNADLVGNTFKVTNREGVTKELDIEALVTEEEKVTVQLASEVSSVSVAGIVLSVYINHGETPTTYTTDAEGKATFSVPIGAYYEVHFPDFADTEEISPIGYTATLPSRTIEATYKAYEGVKAQITVQAQKHEDGVSSVLEGVVLSVKIEDGEAVEYTTDAEGKASFEVAIGKTYTVTMPKVDGYYVADGVYEHTHHATTAAHTIHIMYHQYRVGIFILDKDGKDYTLAEWQAAGKTADEAVLLECSTELLHDNDAVVYFDPVAMSQRSYKSYQWQNAYTQLSTVKSQQTYDGVGQTTNAITEAASIGGSVPAATHARSHEIVIDGETMYGYLGGCLQWVQLWANKEAVDEVLTALYGDTTMLLNDYTANKWTADQSGVGNAWYFTSQPGISSYNKSLQCAVVPFFAY